MNQYGTTLSSIPGIVDQYNASKLKEVVNVVVRLQTDKFREKAIAENQDFVDRSDDSMKSIIKEKV
ncbi:hypothetical protein Tco_1119195, partial [Tanacetum coccineum]